MDEDFINFLQTQNDIITLREELDKGNVLFQNLLIKFKPIREGKTYSKEISPEDLRDFKISYSIYLEHLENYKNILSKIKSS